MKTLSNRKIQVFNVMKFHNYCIDSKLPGLFIRVFLILFFCCNTKIALSQLLTGRVYEYSTNIGLDSIKINIAGTTESTYSDKSGNFKIRAKVDNLIIISGYGYITDTVLLINMRFQEIYLIPQEHLLKEVKVNANNVAPRRSSGGYDPDFHGQTITKQFDNNGNYKGGVVFRFWYWKKDEKRKKKNEQVLKADLAYQKIHEVFCRDTILKYLPLKNEEINGFILRYLPGTEEYMSPGFNLIIYLNKCYKEFNKLPLDDRTKNPIF